MGLNLTRKLISFEPFRSIKKTHICSFLPTVEVQLFSTLRHFMALTNKLKVIEHCRVAPPAGSVADMSLPLTFFDLPWLHFPHIHRVMFYEFPHPKNHFVDYVIPKLKNSASLTLKHFFPLSGNLIVPPNPVKPEIRFINGNSVSLIFAESSNNFNYLIGNQNRNADDFHPLVPQMPQVTNVSGTIVVPLLALQVTLFPNFGICFGIIFHHVIMDASTLMNFLRSWAAVFKSDGDSTLLKDGLSPFYDRTAVKDPKGLEEIYWSQLRDIKFDVPTFQYIPSNKVRTTFIMDQGIVRRLKKLVLTQRPTLPYVSTFTVTCGYIWTCMVKARVANRGEIHEDDLDHFVCNVDCRTRLNPPVPATYFGNCIAQVFFKGKSTKLLGEEGFFNAVEMIGNGIYKRVHNEEGVLNGLENWVSEFQALVLELLSTGKILERAAGVAGSPKLGFYDVDFGWGNPKKIEIISIDVNGAFSLIESRDSEGGLEIGVSLPEIKLNAFATIFEDGLKNL